MIGRKQKKRINIIGQNGNEGLHYKKEQNQKEIEKLEQEANKMRNRPLFAPALSKVNKKNSKIKRWR